MRSLERAVTDAALLHVAWLAKERRHTHSGDSLTRYAIERGWAMLMPGTMGSPWSCVQLTEAGDRAVKSLDRQEWEDWP